VRKMKKHVALLLVVIMAVSVVSAAGVVKAADPVLDKPYDKPQYLVHVIARSANPGRTEDSWMLWPQAPTNNQLKVADGEGGTVTLTTDQQLGPFKTPREVCASAPEAAKQKLGLKCSSTETKTPTSSTTKTRRTRRVADTGVWNDAIYSRHRGSANLAYFLIQIHKSDGEYVLRVQPQHYGIPSRDGKGQPVHWELRWIWRSDAHRARSTVVGRFVAPDKTYLYPDKGQLPRSVLRDLKVDSKRDPRAGGAPVSLDTYPRGGFEMWLTELQRNHDGKWRPATVPW
jgi:hypothetical protein